MRNPSANTDPNKLQIRLPVECFYNGAICFPLRLLRGANYLRDKALVAAIRLCFRAVFGLFCANTVLGEEDPAALDFFETRIRPVLAEKCYSCHSVEAESRGKLKGALYLDSKEGTLKGGKEGAILVPGDLEKSRLVEAVRYTDDSTAMPPKEKLSENAIADIEAWVKMGAPDPRSGDKAPKAGSAIAERTKRHWAFQPLVAPEPPSTAQAEGVLSDLDRFIVAKQETAKLSPAAPASKRSLLRRATFDLTGLPATADEVTAFERDSSPDAFAKVVDRLLDSPAYGERWGRHWLDVARYADTKGYVFADDRSYPYAYTYRDWVVQALNEDMPYDRFLQLQIAADRLAGNETKHLAAMGFLTVGRRFSNNIHEIIDDRLDVLGRGTMGLTIACARCHDHKFDPIPTKDYYALYGVFDSSFEPKDLPVIGSASSPEEKAAFDAELAKRQKDVEDLKSKLFAQRLVQIRSDGDITGCLLAELEARCRDSSAVKEIAVRRKLEYSVVQRWIDWLEKRDAKDPIFAPWKILSLTAESEVAARATELLSGPEFSWINPVLGAALKEKIPNNHQELAELYAEVLSENDQDEPQSDEDKESIRLVLRGIDTPTAFAYKQADDLLTGADKNKIGAAKKKVDELPAVHPGAPPRAMVMQDHGKPHNVRVFLRGQAGNPGELAPRRFLSFLAGNDAKPFSDGSGRLELARAITSPDNPLTPRVIVNRIWAWHFGAGLVRTTSDFGLRTEAPVHCELLDWLACKLVSGGWSLKKMHRLIMLSAVYQQSSAVSDEAKRTDPENLLWSHANLQRLDFESMRDAMLSVSGSLDSAVGGRPVNLIRNPLSNRKTLYSLIDRQNLPGMFRNFDFASPDAHTPFRFQTTVPQQALFLMNSPFVVEQARALAKRTGDVATPEERIDMLYDLVLGRNADSDELKSGVKFLARLEALPSENDPAPVWQYGYGVFDETNRTIETFDPLPSFKEGVWSGGEQSPGSKLAHVRLTRDGGHPGIDHQHAAVRRWTAPYDGTFAVSGKLARAAKNGDGIRALVIPNGQPAVGDWTIVTDSIATSVPYVTLKAGEWIDFVVDCLGNASHDSFAWSAEVAGIEGTVGQWTTKRDFAGPKPTVAPLNAWERYAHALLMTNEFIFVD